MIGKYMARKKLVSEGLLCSYLEQTGKISNEPNILIEYIALIASTLLSFSLVITFSRLFSVSQLL